MERRNNDNIMCELDELKEEVSGLTHKVGQLLEAWDTANGVVKFVKWISGAVAGGGVIWAVLTGNWHR